MKIELVRKFYFLPVFPVPKLGQKYFAAVLFARKKALFATNVSSHAAANQLFSMPNAAYKS
ncbi:hypothetical protein [Planococcus koreensis]|uniref:hypothetical protein n=1 Tax=Planococcus koreensis TaxID=112331 RepID=UPI0039FC83C5